MSQRAKERLLALQPSLRQRECAAWTQETTQARAVLDALGAPPLTSMQELEKILDLVPKGAMLIPEQLATVAQFLASCRRMKAYLKKAEEVNSTLASLGTTIDDLPDLAQPEIPVMAAGSLPPGHIHTALLQKVTQAPIDGNQTVLLAAGHVNFGVGAGLTAVQPSAALFTQATAFRLLG